MTTSVPTFDAHPCRQRNAYFAVINLIGPGIFNLAGDYHHQRDGVLEADAARVEKMIEKIWSAAD